MNIPSLSSARHCVAALGFVVAAGGVSHAQLLVSSTPGQREPGQRYLEASLGVIHPRTALFERDATRTGLVLNLPLTTVLDLGFNHDFATTRSFGVRWDDSVFGATATIHGGTDVMRPFAGVSLARERTTARFLGLSASDDQTVWGLGAGLAWQTGRVTWTPSVSYARATTGDHSSVTQYGVQASTWFSRRIGGFAEAAYSDYTGDDAQAWTYRAGLRWRF